jgi:nicotinate phosphoribosyltransferase
MAATGPASILDTDLYKLTMQQAVALLYPRAQARYAFINRGGDPFPPGFAQELGKRIREMEGLRLSPEERRWLERRCPYFTPAYLDLLEGYRFNPDEVHLEQTGGVLTLFVEGYWYRAILWEVPLMSLISELYFEMSGEGEKAWPEEERRKKAAEKAALFKDNRVRFVDFGTRRRFSYENHLAVVEELRGAGEFFLGTSCVHLARLFDLAPIGTQAHEWFQFHAVAYGFLSANRAALDNWVEVYRGELGIALTDTYGTDNFLKSFDGRLARLFDGVRQDSGDPFAVLEKVIEHYRGLRIDPATKTLVFSDSLEPRRVLELHRACAGRIRDIYGIGTNLTNDVGVKPLNMVIKLVACRPDESSEWIPAVKLSDDTGKYTGDRAMIELCRRTLGAA